MLSEHKDAADVYEQLLLADPTNNDTKMKLAEIYEILNEPRRALDLVYEVIGSRRKARRDGKSQQSDREESIVPSSSSLFVETSASGKKGSKSNRLNTVQLKELEAEKEKEVLRGWKRLCEIWDEEEKLEEWLMEAEKLVEAFRETRNLFSTTRVSGC